MPLHRKTWFRLLLLLALLSLGAARRAPAQTAYAWGQNDYGQLGNGTTTARAVPDHVVDPADPTGFLQNVVILGCGGRHSIALKTDGTVWAWGLNGQGELGDGTTTFHTTPVQVKDFTDPTGYLHNIVAIAAGANHNLAAKSDGTVWAWGYNSDGQLGDGSTTNRLAPVQVKDPTDPTGFLQNAVLVAAGTFHSQIVKADGTAWACGENSYGTLGDGTNTGRTLPVQVKDPTDPTGYLQNVVSASAGLRFSVLLKADGTVWACGWNGLGQLGDGTTANRSTPVQTVDPADPTGTLQNVVSLSAGGYHSLALKPDGTCAAWGDNGYGQLGDPTAPTIQSTPITVTDPTDPSGYLQGVVTIAGGFSHSLAAKGDGTAWGWGLNDTYQLGDGTRTTRTVPAQIGTQRSGYLQGAVVLAGGQVHSLAAVAP